MSYLSQIHPLLLAAPVVALLVAALAYRVSRRGADTFAGEPPLPSIEPVTEPCDPPTLPPDTRIDPPPEDRAPSECEPEPVAATEACATEGAAPRPAPWATHGGPRYGTASPGAAKRDPSGHRRGS